MNIAICDDEPIFLVHIKKMIKEYEENHSISYFEDSEELLKQIVEGNKFDIYILDIEMPEIDGVKLAAFINKRKDDAIIIFLTSHTEYVYYSFKINIFRYVRKSYIESELKEAIDSAIEKLKENNIENDIYVYNRNNVLENICYSDIMYIRKYSKNVEIHLLDKTVKKDRKSISQIYEELNGNIFIFCDRGTLVNIENILKIETNKITMINNDELFISRSKVNEFNQNILNYWGNKM